MFWRRRETLETYPKRFGSSTNALSLVPESWITKYLLSLKLTKSCLTLELRVNADHFIFRPGLVFNERFILGAICLHLHGIA